MGVALPGGCHASSLQKAYFVDFLRARGGFLTFAFYDTSRRPILSYSHFQGVKLKLRSRAFCWGVVCFCTCNGSFRILNLKSVSFGLLHPVRIMCVSATNNWWQFFNSYEFKWLVNHFCWLQFWTFFLKCFIALVGKSYIHGYFSNQNYLFFQWHFGFSSYFLRRPRKLTKSSPSIWHLLHSVKLTVKISSTFVAFWENMNFKLKRVNLNCTV